MQQHSKALLNSFKRFQKQLGNYWWFFFNPYKKLNALFLSLSKPFEAFFLFFSYFFLILLDVPYQSVLDSILAISVNIYMMLICPILLVISSFTRLLGAYIAPGVINSLNIQDTTEYKELQQLISEINVERQIIYDLLNKACDQERRECAVLKSRLDDVLQLIRTSVDVNENELSIQLSSLQEEIKKSVQIAQSIYLSQQEGNQLLNSYSSNIQFNSFDSYEEKFDKLTRGYAEMSNHHKKYKLWAESIFNIHASSIKKIRIDADELGQILKNKA
jgi:hypothetical protein